MICHPRPPSGDSWPPPPAPARTVCKPDLDASFPLPMPAADMVCNLTLVDPSTPDRADLAAGIEMLCFAATPHELPHIRRPGDIIRLHRVKVGVCGLMRQ